MIDLIFKALLALALYFYPMQQHRGFNTSYGYGKLHNVGIGKNVTK